MVFAPSMPLRLEFAWRFPNAKRRRLTFSIHDIRRRDAGARRHLATDTQQALFERGKHLQHAVGPCVVPHQADAPDLALEVAQSAADLDAEVAQKLFANRQ